MFVPVAIKCLNQLESSLLPQCATPHYYLNSDHPNTQHGNLLVPTVKHLFLFFLCRPFMHYIFFLFRSLVVFCVVVVFFGSVV